jgi:acyl-CoA thioesterase-2
VTETAAGFDVPTMPTPTPGVLGAHLLFQQVLLAERAAPGRRVLELHTTFLRGGYPGESASVSVEVVSEGRSFSFLELSFRQRGELTCRSEVLLTVDEDDFLRLQAPGPDPVDPESWTVGLSTGPGVRRLGPDAGRCLRTVSMQLDEPLDATTTRAVLAMASEPEVHLVLLRPDAPGGGGIPIEKQASFVLKQTITFLEEADLVSGVLLTSSADYAGRGRSHGHGAITDLGGRLLATYSTTGVMREGLAPTRPG